MERIRVRAAAMVLLALPTLAAAQADPRPRIAWETDYHQAVQQAEESGKPVLIDFYATWCGPCKMMDEQTYTDPDVIQALGDYVAVKVDVDAAEKVAFAYGVQSIPRTVVLNIHREMVGDRVGFLERDDFLALLKDVQELIHKKVDGTVITVADASPRQVAIAPDTEFSEVMALLANPDPAVREKALSLLQQLDRTLAVSWMRRGLASTYLGDRIAAKAALAAMDDTTYVNFDPWAPEDERAKALAASE